MNQNKITLKTATPQDFGAIEAIYKEAFPQVERKPFKKIIDKIALHESELCCVFYENSTKEASLAGFVCMYFYKNYALIDYFAISPKFRNLGIGARALELILEKYKDKNIFLEIEDSQRGVVEHKRMCFYSRLGFELCGLDVVLFTVPMQIMTYNCSITYEEYFSLYMTMTGGAVLPTQRKDNSLS